MKHLEVTGLSKQFSPSAPPAVDSVSFSMQSGEILGLLGPSGCGKTTTLRMIAGFERPDAGEVMIDGQSITRLPPEKRHIGFVFQDYALFPDRTVLNNVVFALHQLPRNQRIPRGEELLEMVGLRRERDRYPHELSGGQQQRVALARTLAAEPKLILLDEPFSNLDAALRESTRRDVRTLLKRTNMSAILVTHDQEEALSFCDTLGVMHAGSLEQLGTPETIYLRPATSFVAQFLGRANLMRGTAVGDSAETPLGTIPIHPAASGTVLISLRPEHLDIQVVNQDEPEAPQTLATVVSREFRGHDLTYRVKQGYVEYIVHTDFTCDVEPGTSVRLLPRRPAVVLEESGLCRVASAPYLQHRRNVSSTVPAPVSSAGE